MIFNFMFVTGYWYSVGYSKLLFYNKEYYLATYCFLDLVETYLYKIQETINRENKNHNIQYKVVGISYF
jgi:hypothetical protein